MKVAAVQMRTKLANLRFNMDQARTLAEEGFRAGAEWVVLPEFFPTAVGFHPDLNDVAQPLDGPAMGLLTHLAKTHDGVIGGSFISIRDGGRFNTFVLAFPDGATYFHDKDLPTMWENCYYQGGHDDGVLETARANVGAALCWEFIRTATVRRMLRRVDFVVGGSCWWTLPKLPLPGFPRSLHDKNLAIMQETIPRFARMLGVPVVHAAHAGEFKSRLPLFPGFPYHSHFLGETQIVDGTGKQLVRMGHNDGEGVVTADIDIRQKHLVSESIPDGFWIPDLPAQFKLIWALQNWHGRRYYQKNKEKGKRLKANG